MATESGYGNQKKIGEAQYKTIHNLGSDRYGAAVSSKALYELNAVGIAITGVIEDGNFLYLEVTAHGARVGDVIRVIDGPMTSYELEVMEVVDANSIKVPNLKTDNISIPVVGNLVKPMRWVTSKSDAEGNVNFSPGPTTFIQNAASATVTEDAVTPANNKPLPAGMYFYKDGVATPVRTDSITPSNTAPMPVEIFGAGTTINLTAGDINVQLSSEGATFDSTRIGDGSGVYLDINPDGSINVLGPLTDAQLRATPINVLGPLTDAQLRASAVPVSMASAPLPADAATATKQDAQTVELQAIKTAVQLLDNAVNSDGTPAGTAGLMIGGIDGAGAFQQASVNPAGELSVTFGSAGFATETTLAALNAKHANDFGSRLTALRTAAQIGNATGPADFNAGADSAQTLRVSANLKRAGNELSYGEGAADANTVRVALSNEGKPTRSFSDPLSSSSTPLAANAAFNGAWFEALQYADLCLTVKIGQIGTLFIDYSHDGITVATNEEIPMTPINGKLYTFGCKSRFMRVRFVNGATAQTVFSLQSIWQANAVKPSTHTANDIIVDSDDCELIKSLITGKAPDGFYKNVQVTNGGNLKISLQEVDGNFVMPSRQVAQVASYQELLTITTTAQTITAPVGAKWCKVMADDTNVANLRVKIGGAATVTSGMQFQPGRSEDYSAAGDISVIAESGTGNKIYVQFGV